jgi:precorrin-2 dehydrogenase/sirohydrochlorin ferrochelatase
MIHYPLFVDIRDKKVLVVGGGKVALRKINGLLEAEAAVTVIAPEVGTEVQELGADSKISLIKRKYMKGDINGMLLVFAATDNPDVNMQVVNDAGEAGVLVNCVDGNVPGGFTVPSTIRRGKFTCALSTSGAVPFFTKRLREFLEKKFYPALGDDIESLEHMRSEILSNLGPEESVRGVQKEVAKKQVFEEKLGPYVNEIINTIDKQ